MLCFVGGVWIICDCCDVDVGCGMVSVVMCRYVICVVVWVVLFWRDFYEMMLVVIIDVCDRCVCNICVVCSCCIGGV